MKTTDQKKTLKQDDQSLVERLDVHSALRSVHAFLSFTQSRFIENRCLDSAAALTLASLFALVPTITVLYAILAMIPSLQIIGQEIQDWVFAHLVPSTGLEVQTYIQGFAAQAKHLTSVGLALLFLTALTMLRRIERAFNIIWHVRMPRKGLISFLRYWAVLSLGPLLLGLSLVLTSYVTSLKLFSDTVRLLAIQQWGLGLLPFVTSWAAFTLLNWVVPNCRVAFNAALLGGLIAALGFEVAKRLFSSFVSHFPSYQLVYGAFAFFPLFIIWVYVSWIIILLGALLTRVISVYRIQNLHQAPWMLNLMTVLHLFWRYQRKAEPVSEWTVKRELPQLPPEDWESIRNLLLDSFWLRKTVDDGYAFVGHFQSLTLSKVLHELAGVPDFAKFKFNAKVLEPWQIEMQAQLAQIAQCQQEPLQQNLEHLFSQCAHEERSHAI